MHLGVAGKEHNYVCEALTADQNTGCVDLEPAVSGQHTIAGWVMGIGGGCNTGGLTDWGGTLEIVTR